MLIGNASRTLKRLETKIFDPEWLRPVLDDISDGFLLERNEEIVYVNNAYATFLGRRPGDILLQHVSTVPAPEDALRLLDFSRRRVNLEPAPRDYDFRAVRKDSSSIRLQASVTSSIVHGQVLITAVARPFYSATDVADTAAPVPVDPNLKLLSPRELEVMEMILAGKRVKEIALSLGVSSKTVATHRGRLLRKMNLADNRAIFQYAIRHRLIDWT